MLLGEVRYPRHSTTFCGFRPDVVTNWYSVSANEDTVRTYPGNTPYGNSSQRAVRTTTLAQRCEINRYIFHPDLDWVKIERLVRGRFARGSRTADDVDMRVILGLIPAVVAILGCTAGLVSPSGKVVSDATGMPLTNVELICIPNPMKSPVR